MSKRAIVFDDVMISTSRYYSFITEYLQRNNYDNDSWELVIDLTHQKHEQLSKKYNNKTTEITHSLFVLILTSVEESQKSKNDVTSLLLSKEVKSYMQTAYRIGKKFFSLQNKEEKQNYLDGSVALIKQQLANKMLANEASSFFEALNIFLSKGII